MGRPKLFQKLVHLPGQYTSTTLCKLKERLACGSHRVIKDDPGVCTCAKCLRDLRQMGMEGKPWRLPRWRDD